MIRRLGLEYPKISTKEELQELLKKYKLVLNNHMCDYLECLIDLEVPVTKDFIYPDERVMLSQLDIYRKASIYNIHALSLDLLEKYGDSYNLETIDEYGVLKARLDGVDVLDYDFRVSDEKGNLGKISLFQTIENLEAVKQEMDRVMEKLDTLYGEKCPFLSPKGVYGGPGDFWSSKHEDETKRYEGLLEKLDTNRVLSDKDKKEIEISNLFSEEYFKLFGLDRESFSESKDYPLGSSRTCLEKKLVKKMSLLTIEDNIKYI